MHIDPGKPFTIEADASDFALGSILSQLGEDGQTHPVAFHSRKFTVSEINYEVHDKELLAVVDSFEQWCHFLEGSPLTLTLTLTPTRNQSFQQTEILDHLTIVTSHNTSVT